MNTSNIFKPLSTYENGSVQGFTLIQLSIMLTVAALVLVTVLPAPQSTLAANSSTTANMNVVFTALRNFQAANGRLPCPADASLPIGNTNYGKEAANPGTTNDCTGGSPSANFTDATNNIATGMVPVRTLALSNDYALDAFGRDFLYAVDTNATALGWPSASLAGLITVYDAALGSNQSTVAALVSYGVDGHGARIPMPGSSGGSVRLNAGSTDTDQLVNAHVTSGFAAASSALLATAEGTTSAFVKKQPNSTFDDSVVYSNPSWNLHFLPSSVPQITAIASPANGTYCSGTALTFTLTYSSAVIVTTTGGTPRLTLTIGSNTRYAAYQSGSGTNKLTFSYTIVAADSAPSGISIAASVDTNGGTIKAGTAYSVTGFTAPNLTGVIIGCTPTIYIADTANNRIRKVDTAGIITTVAGNGFGGYGGNGGAATNASIFQPEGVAVDSAGNFYIVDTNNDCIRKVNTAGIISTYAGMCGFSGYNGEGPATSYYLNNPSGIAVDSAGNVYIADTDNYRIRKVNTSGIISTVAGNGSPTYVGMSDGEGGPATNAPIGNVYGVCGMNGGGGIGCWWGGGTGPMGIAVDNAGNFYFSDQSNSRVRKVNGSGIISTVAGAGANGYSGDGGLATNAQLNGPYGLGLDSAGNLYIADVGNSRVRKVNTSGIISTAAGNGSFGLSGDGGSATSAKLNGPDDVKADSQGNIYIADQSNSRIRKVDTSGIISTVAGVSAGNSGDGGPATSAYMQQPYGVWIVNSR